LLVKNQATATMGAAIEAMLPATAKEKYWRGVTANAGCIYFCCYIYWS
jgi:hypothetical protein